MNKIKQFLFSPKGTTAIFGAAMALLLLSSIGGANAALTITSLTHETEISTKEIDVKLLENGEDVPDAGLFTGLLEGDKETIKAGVDYQEELSVMNTGGIPQYVRVTIYRYWEKEGAPEEDNKARNVWPGYIGLDLAPGWVEDPRNEETPERMIIYYTEPVGVNEVIPFVTGLEISSDVAGIVTVDEETKEISYDYQNLKFKVDVEVDAVQTHNAADAILSTWGCKVDNSNPVENGVLKNLNFQW